MRIAVCDDDEMIRKLLDILLKEYAENNPEYNINVSLFDHADNLLEAVQKYGDYDIYILDVIMPDTNGIKLGVLLREGGNNGKIIYLTAEQRFVFDSFIAQPLNYIIKPITKERLFQVIDDAINIIEYKREKSIIIRTLEGSLKIQLENIMYGELVNRTIVYHLANGETVASTTIRASFVKTTEELVAEGYFVLCGISVIANVMHVTSIKNEEVYFRDGSSIKLSRKLLTELRAKWCDYWQKN